MSMNMNEFSMVIVTIFDINNQLLGKIVKLKFSSVLFEIYLQMHSRIVLMLEFTKNLFVDLVKFRIYSLDFAIDGRRDICSSTLDAVF